MASFNNLPLSLLHGVTRELDQQSLNSLCQTNRFFEEFLTLQFHYCYAVQDRGSLPTLCWAAKKGHHKLVDLLLSRPAINVDVQDPIKARTPLHQAAKQGHEEIVRELLSRKPLLNFPDKAGQTALHCAAMCGHESIVGLLLDGGDCLDSEDKDGKTPLQHAIRCGERVMKNCASKMGFGSSWYLPRDLKMNAWKTVAERRDGTVRELLRRGASVITFERNGYTPLHNIIDILDETEEEAEIAEDLGISTLKLLFEFGAKAILEKRETCGGCMPLHMATMYGFVSIVRFLVEEGAELDTKTNDGDTPLHIAAKDNEEENMYEIFELLIEHAADVNVLDDLSRTPLHCAALFNNGNAKMVHKLLQITDDIECRDIDGRTTLHLAVLNRSVGIAKMVLDAGVDVDSQNSSLQTALHEAITLDHHKMVRLLLENAADTEIRDDQELTALQVALSKSSEGEGNLEIISELLRYGASVTSKNQLTGWTALHTAVSNKEIGGAKLLLEKGADVNAKDVEGITPFRLAQQRADIEMVRLLTRAREKAGLEVKKVVA